MTRQQSARVDRSRVVAARAAEFGRRSRHVKGVVAFTLQTIVFQLRAIFDDDLCDRICEIPAIADGSKILD